VVQFASARATTSGAALIDTAYAQFNDSRITSREFKKGLVTYSGVVGYGNVSHYGGIGFTACIKKDCSPIDATRFRSVTVWLASPTVPKLRFRVLGPDKATGENGCYPIYMQEVSEDLAAYEIPLSAFTNEEYCGRGRARTMAQTLPAVVGFEIVDAAVRGKSTAFTVGAIDLNP
jgi:hypothetical protein